MSQVYDNWEKLLDAVYRKEQYLELCALSDTSSSECSSSSRTLSPPPHHDDELLFEVLDKGERVSGKWLPRLAAVAGGAIKGWRLSQKAELPHPGSGMVPRAAEGESIAAGWPVWLAAVAGEAIRGWVPRRADSFEKIDKIGSGTFSNVYLARDCVVGKLVALKKVRIDTLKPESVRYMAREILILRRLDHPNVIKLEGLVTSWMASSLYLIFEYMEHDLAGLAYDPEIRFTEPQIKCYMHQLLCGLEHCHGRHVLHRDIKCSNLLIDNNGVLKIADFGTATFFDPHHNVPLTSRVVTLWYRPPELLLGATYYGPAVDLWSTACIMAELYAGKPIMPGRTEVEQLHKIFKLCGSPSDKYWGKAKLPHASIFKPQQPYQRQVAETFKEFPVPAVTLMEILLAIDPADRGSAASALMSEFFKTSPQPSDPSRLPKYPPRKESTAKLRDEEANRIRRQFEPKKKGSRESHAEDVPNFVPKFSLPLEVSQKSMMRQDQIPNFRAADSPWHEDERTNNYRAPHSYASGEKTIRFSGPLLQPSSSVDEMLKEHDRQIQEAGLRARLNIKPKLHETGARGNPIESSVVETGG